MTKLHQPRFMCKPLQIVYAHINPRLARQKEGQAASFYADAFLRAFPMALAEIPQERSTRVEPEEDFHRVWELRTVFRFAEYFGLVELRPDPDPPATLAP